LVFNNNNNEGVWSLSAKSEMKITFFKVSNGFIGKK